MFELLSPAHQALTALLAGLLGLLIGSFLNVVIHRVPRMIEREQENTCAEIAGKEAPHGRYNVLLPRSQCGTCSHTLGVFENIPLMSYALQKGRCKSCKAPISIRYPIIELAVAAIFAAITWQQGLNFFALGSLIFCTLLLALAAIDLDTFLLPDVLTYPLLWLGLLWNMFNHFTTLHNAVLGAVLGYLALWSVYWIFKLITGKEGMGYGDFKLLAALGAWLGWQMLPMIILLSSLVGAVVGIGLIMFTKRGSQTPIPFGPYLAAAGAIAYFWGRSLNQNYLSFVF